MKIQDLLVLAAARIAPFSDTPQLDAQVLLAHFFEKPRAWVAAHPEYEADEAQVEPALKKLETGVPLPYVLGRWEFFGLEFDLTPDVLIPRPETETLVEKALTWLNAHPQKRRIADIGTGSGAIAVSIAKQIPDARILATDLSPAALEIAKRNAKKHGVEGQIQFVECDLLPASKVESQNSDLQPSASNLIDLLCSNPPYIPAAALRRLPIFGREPTLALDGGIDGMDAYRRIFEIAPRWLAPQGAILFEIESSLGNETLRLGRSAFPKAKIQIHKDLAGKDRVMEIEFR
ncbi:MAG: peptide chain release factor N(5)-glutamine methyltransferase [Chloroflexi bacterium]|nr:peptide chain release factor N(5)-glutamine methyltransferase [Chloroflexota bacterium]MCA2001044.1 peptide chain release factor N(5)-glutamine methyltransferase [Chloroflexota bacterium]